MQLHGAFGKKQVSGHGVKSLGYVPLSFGGYFLPNGNLEVFVLLRGLSVGDASSYAEIA